MQSIVDNMLKVGVFEDKINIISTGKQVDCITLMSLHFYVFSQFRNMSFDVPAVIANDSSVIQYEKTIATNYNHRKMRGYGFDILSEAGNTSTGIILCKGLQDLGEYA